MAERVPPEDFRHLSVIPTLRDIITDERPFLRPNKIHGPYDNTQHYLDVQFRLLREDFMKPLRDGIQTLLVMGKHRTPKDESLLDVRVYDNVEIGQPVFTSNGIAYQITFDISKLHKVQWENSKRLIFGSLLCLSKNNFESFAFATVANRELEDVANGVIEIRFVSPNSEVRPRTGDKCEMVESLAFFESCRPVLEGLKNMPFWGFPFKRYIVECEKEVLPPRYLRRHDGSQVKFDFSPIISPNCRGFYHRFGRSAVLDSASWPSARELGLDKSQFKALQLALTNEFAVIQGPPGTGKTYIGLKIAQILLHNKTVWRTNSTEGPILVVCYTNHALDQFLEEIYKFHRNGIVRVGGRSQSEVMKKCSLWETKQKMLSNSISGKAKDEMSALSERFEEHKRMINTLKTDVVDEEVLSKWCSSLTTQHYETLKNGMTVCDSVMPYWLGLPVKPPDPYDADYSKPLLMFPFNQESRDREYFSKRVLAFMSPDLRFAQGADGSRAGSVELRGNFDSFIEIPNFVHGYGDAAASGSITILAFLYPSGGHGPILCYEKNGYGLQIRFEQFDAETGTLCALFVRRDLAEVIRIRSTILNINAWNFIGISYDHWTGVARLWHNGNEVETVLIGANFPLATQFPIRIGALDSPWQTSFFTGRISHLHIYSEALDIENIRAVGCISQTEDVIVDDEQLGEAAQEELKASFVGAEEPEGNTAEEYQKVPDVRFEAYVMEDQRILDGDDDFIRFDKRVADHERSKDDKSLNNLDHIQAENSKNDEEDQQQGGWRFQNSARVRQRVKRTIQRELRNQNVMCEKDACMVENVWNLCSKDRWRLYRRWVHDACERCHTEIAKLQVTFEEEARNLKYLKEVEDGYILSKADVIGMTTTGAARYQNVLQAIRPVITIVEEAAEVLEAHIITSLTPDCQHLILIGDHQQLRPNPTVYNLQINYNFDVSLFERMIKNGMEFARLCLQHRMRPEIAKMLDHIYVDPKLENHVSVLKFEDIRGVQRNLFFLEHNEHEDFVDEGRSRSNTHEAKFMTAFCRYLIQQGYKQSQITILAAYTGQLSKLKREMSSKYKKLFEGVRVSVVDNFQGEENDIILLSLVRSDRSGFLKIDNRVCVALSRARKGLFIIGNSTVLARESALWRNIFKDMREQGVMGRELRLTCKNHPNDGIQASSAADFDNAPEGGCSRPCGIKMECGHACSSVCHPVDLDHKEKFLCQEPCSKIICLSGHKCRNKCSQKCGPCMEIVTKVIPGCEHEKRLPCSVDVKKVKGAEIVPKKAFLRGHVNKMARSDAASVRCETIVPKEAWPCGHLNKVPCFVMPSDIKCKMPCGELQCGHKCMGNCHQCHQGRLHKPCQSKCDRPLVCGHSCKDDCSRVCLPCSNKCENYCEHCTCNKTCGDRCTPCTIECSWKCPHFSCTKPCHEPCNRPRCDKPCEKKLPCGHSCIGVCGEECPKLCRVCDGEADDFKGCEPQAMFVELVDCGHVFEVKTLDEFMDKSQDKEWQNGKMEIKHRKCPKCSKPILSSRRYGKIIKEILADFDAVKRQRITSDVAASDKIKNIVYQAAKIKACRNDADKIVKEITDGRVTPEEIIKLQNQVLFIKSLDSTIQLAKIVDDKTLLRKVYGLESRIMENHRCFSEQEIEELTEELSRSKLLVSFRYFMTILESKHITLSPEDNTYVHSIGEALDSGKAIDRQRKKYFFADIVRIKRKYGLQLQAEGTLDEDSDLTGKLAKAKNLSRGPWYKCIKGHVYPAADQIPAHKNNLYVSCPHCVEETKSTPRTMTETLSPQMTPGEIAETMKPQPTSSSRARLHGYRGRPRKNFRFRK